MQDMRKDALVGNASQTADKLRALAKQLELDELVVCSWTHDPAAQLRSFELMAQAF
jgi:alkanesulfonate monooxygenase SsuD/methylene tetrahydromethanopterin reductase-like flavin-dependent oxidoreductase (luciferase family)